MRAVKQTHNGAYRQLGACETLPGAKLTFGDRRANYVSDEAASFTSLIFTYSKQRAMMDLRKAPGACRGAS
jgi:hypothetical protein